MLVRAETTRSGDQGSPGGCFGAETGYQGNNCAHRSLANLRNLIKCTSFSQQLEGFLGWPGRFCPPTGTRALPLPEILHRLEDLLSVHLNLLIAEAGHAPQLLEIRWFNEAQVFQSRIVQDDKRGNSLILRGVPPPLSQKLIQLSIDRRFSDAARGSRWR